MNQRFSITLDDARGTQMSCREARCENWANGFAVVLDPQDAKHVAMLKAIKADLRRRYVQLQSEAAAAWVAAHGAAQGITDHEGKLATLLANTPPGMLVLVYPPGQSCYQRHTDREVVFTHRAPRGAVRVHERFEDYREHWDEEAYRVNELMRRG